MEKFARGYRDLMPTGTLPKEGRKLFESVYKDSLKGSCNGDKGCAAASAWSVVKKKYKKNQEGKWVKKGNPVAEFSMHITKASLHNGEMRWSAVNSDTDYDSYEERMSVDLYESFIEHIKSGIPETYKSAVCSEYWCGGMPYLSVSHYPDLNGKAVPGEPLKLFIDGNKLKAKGILFDNPLGHSVWRSLKEDKVKSPEDKIRISIGFLDLAHKHGEEGNIWVRENEFSLCPECLQGIGDKIYLKGCLIHLALTRVPVNKRTEFIEEKSMAKPKTRKEDAESIVGKDAAEEIEKAQKVSKQRSDFLIEMSETEEETEELVNEIEATETPEEPAEEPEEEAEEAVGEADSSEEIVLESETEEKSEDDIMANAVTEPVGYAENLPYGGATSMRDAEQYLAAKEEAYHLMDMWGVFLNVVWNIFDRSDVENKRSALNQAVDEFKNVLTAKAMVAFSITEKSLPSVNHELQSAIDELLKEVDNSLTLESNSERAGVLNPAMQVLGKAITDWIEQKSVAQEDEPTAPDANENTLLDDIKELLLPITESVKSLSEEVGVLKAKSQVQNVDTPPRIPASRTLSSKLIQKSEEKPAKQNSVRDIARKSVGLNQ